MLNPWREKATDCAGYFSAIRLSAGDAIAGDAVVNDRTGLGAS